MKPINENRQLWPDEYRSLSLSSSRLEPTHNLLRTYSVRIALLKRRYSPALSRRSRADIRFTSTGRQTKPKTVVGNPLPQSRKSHIEQAFRLDLEMQLQPSNLIISNDLSPPFTTDLIDTVFEMYRLENTFAGKQPVYESTAFHSML